MSITGRPDDAPVRGGIPIGDLGGGIFGAMGVLAALQARHATGVGQHVDVSMLDAQISLLTYMATMYLMSGHVPGRIGNSHFVHVPYNTFATRDGHVIIACIGDAFYERFLKVVPHPELLRPEYLKQPVRYAAREKIDAIINDELGKNTSAYWLAKLREARIPCGPVNDFAQALSDPQIVARDMVVEVPLPGGTRVPMPGIPMKFSDAATPEFKTPPTLGRDTRSVLGELLGYDAAKIDSLREARAIQ
jgi:crotonobetainyl-CoA:carnitine CoA-transferase CaiB-like acyl-CoA transferase